MDADKGVWDGDTCLGNGGEDGQGSADTLISRTISNAQERDTYSELTKRSTFCSTISSEEPFNATFSGAVGAEEASAGKMGSLPRCELGTQAFAPTAW